MKIWLETAKYNEVTLQMAFYAEDETLLARPVLWYERKLGKALRDGSLGLLFAKLGAQIDHRGDELFITLNGKTVTPAGSMPFQDHVMQTLADLGVEVEERRFSDRSENAQIDLQLPKGTGKVDFVMSYLPGAEHPFGVEVPGPRGLYASTIEDAKLDAADLKERMLINGEYVITDSEGDEVYSSAEEARASAIN